MSDSLRDRIAAALFRSDWGHQRDWHKSTDEFKQSYRDDADAVIAALKDDGWTLAPPGVAVFTETYVGNGLGTYTAHFCRGGCDCSCCYGMADEPCHCRDAVCNCGGDRAAHGQKPLEGK